jgi:hypothetical protein
MRRIESQRRQKRHQLAKEVGPDPGLLRVVPLAPPQKAYALGGQRGEEIVVEQPVHPLAERVHFGRYRPEHLFGRQAVGTGLVVAGGDLSLQAGDANLEEFVEIAIGDA